MNPWSSHVQLSRVAQEPRLHPLFVNYAFASFTVLFCSVPGRA